MPQVRKLNENEIRTIERKTLGTRKATEIEYDRLLADFAPGDYGEVTLHEGEKRLTVRNRLKAAAQRHDPPLALTFQRTRGETLRFTVASADGRATSGHVPPTLTLPTEEPVTAAPAPRKRGRPPGRKGEAAAASAPPEEARPRRRRKAGGAG